MSLILTVERLWPHATLPFKTYDSDTCWDVTWSPKNADSTRTYLNPGKRLLLGTGLRVAPPEGYGIQVRPRSGIANKYMTTVMNAPGTVDQNYRGELMIILANHGQAQFVIGAGDRIAQICLEQVVKAEVVEGNVDTCTDRGTGGCGSTGR